jgi:hypothetical protein
MHAALSSQHDGDNRDVLIHTHTLVPSFQYLEFGTCIVAIIRRKWKIWTKQLSIVPFIFHFYCKGRL